MRAIILCVASLVLSLAVVPCYGVAAPETRGRQLNKRWGFDKLKDIKVPQVHVDLGKVVKDISRTGKSLGETIQDSLEDTFDRASRVFDGDWWERALSLGQRLEKYGDTLLDDARAKVPEIGPKLDQFKNIVNSIVEQTRKFESDIAATSIEQVHAIDWDAMSKELGEKFQLILDEIKAEFPPPDQAPSHEQRQDMVRKALSKAEEYLVEVGVKHGLNEESLRSHFQAIQPHVEMLIVITGDLIEQHPILFSTVVTAAVFMIIPESWLLRPLLSVFGFGPSGPVKGSTAAWAQRRFFGAIIEKGSWFSHLQRAGMTVPAKGIFGAIFGGIGATIGLSFGLFRECRR